jgi:kumamolisin
MHGTTQSIANRHPSASRPQISASNANRGSNMPPANRFGSQQRVVLTGSEKAPFKPGGKETVVVSAAKAKGGSLTVSVIVNRKAPIDMSQRMTRAAFARQNGADPNAVRLVKVFAAECGLKATGPDPGRQAIQLAGTVAKMQKAFGVTLSSIDHDGQSYRVREGAIYIPQELAGHVTAVLGLDNRPQAQPHFRIAARATNTSYTPVQVGQLYGFPTGATATGQTIGIIELGGGFRATDLKLYFQSLNLPVPSVTAVPVDKGKNAPGTASSADGEVMLDIEVCGAIAPGAKIAVYFAPNTDQGFIDSISTAVHDSKNKPSVISISWGGPESSWTGQAIAALDSACQAAVALGVTITVACGDNGSTDGVAGAGNHVDFPASSPHVLACGGTKLLGSGTTISSEVVWNEIAANEGATGGGVSAVFPLPTWQIGIGVPAASSLAGGRGVPDVSGDADPVTGYTIRVDGQTLVFGGTSAVAPLWASLITLANAQNKTTAGFANPALYVAKKTFRDITQGNNGGFIAGPGWDPCTGLGSPVGTAVIQALKMTAAKAGTPKKGAKP